MGKAIYSMQLNQHTIVSIIVMVREGDCSLFASLWSCGGLCGFANVLQFGIAKTAFPKKCSGVKSKLLVLGRAVARVSLSQPIFLGTEIFLSTDKLSWCDVSPPYL